MATGAFSVIPPQGKGWSRAISPDSQVIQFTRQKKGFPGVTHQEATDIRVFLTSTTPENAARGADSVAKDFMDQEEARLRAGPEKLMQVRRGTDSIGPYHLYLFEPRTRLTTSWEYLYTEQQLFIYFPPDFESRYEFFLFLITKAHPPYGAFEKTSFKDIRPVIESFRDERPPLAEVSLQRSR